MTKLVPAEFLFDEYKDTNINDPDIMIKTFLLNCLGDTPYKLEKVYEGYLVTFNEWEVV